MTAPTEADLAVARRVRPGHRIPCPRTGYGIDVEAIVAVRVTWATMRCRCDFDAEFNAAVEGARLGREYAAALRSVS